MHCWAHRGPELMTRKLLVKFLIFLGVIVIVVAALVRGFLSLTDVTRETILTAPPDNELRPTQPPAYRPLIPPSDDDNSNNGNTP